jgi:protein SCO1
MNRRDLITGTAPEKPVRSASRGPEFYTNARLRTHEGREVRFYDDLIKGKIVTINFMYTQCEGVCPTSTMNLVKLQKALGDRVGRDIFFYSISLKPEEDDTAKLKQYVADHGVGPGWLFLTGDDFDLTTIRVRLSDRTANWNNPALDFDIEEHTGMLTCINDPQDRWNMVPLGATTRQLVRAVTEIEPTKSFEERFRDNLRRQAIIDEEEAA